MTAAEIFRRLRADGSIHTGEVSQATVERFVREQDLYGFCFPA